MAHMRVAIVGPGAVGGLLGGLLARQGHEVGFLARGGTLEALVRDGLSVSTPGGSFVVERVRAASEAAEIGACDLVLVAVKAWQVQGLAGALAPLVGPESIVVPLQNGVEAPEHLAAALPEARVVGGLCHVLATREGRTAVHVTSAARRAARHGRRARGEAGARAWRSSRRCSAAQGST